MNFGFRIKKGKLFYSLCMFVLLLLSCSKEEAVDDTITGIPSTTHKYKIATYNVRVKTNSDETDHSWTKRHYLIANIVTKYEFDLFGVQEPLGVQIDDMVKDLPEYGRFGVSDHNNYSYQHQDIFYKKDKFNVLKTGRFWMAPGGPAIPPTSKPWGAKYDPYVCTWGLFEDKSIGFQFYVFNTHFDAGSSNSRLESAKLMISKITFIAGTKPVIFMGDLNTNQFTDSYKILVSSNILADSYVLAKSLSLPTKATYNGWDTNPTADSRIDHILVSSHWNVLKYSILDDTYNGELPSDHFPVILEVSNFFK